MVDIEVIVVVGGGGDVHLEGGERAGVVVVMDIIGSGWVGR